MPNEIYHRSDWGESKAEDFGDVYYDHAATNKLYNHSDYYENSDGTDATLKDLNNKASIVLTPTAYSDGSLNTVIPPYAPSYIENVPFVTSEWTNLQQGWSIDETNNKLVAEATWTGVNKNAQYDPPEILAYKTVKVSFDAVITAGSFQMYRPLNRTINESGSYTFTGVAFGANFFRLRNKSTDFAGEITNIRIEVIEEADFDFSRGSSATRVNEQGLVENSQGNDFARIDFTDGTGSLLIEPQRTNLISYSEDFSSLDIRNNAVVTSDAILSPSGLLNADEITFDGTSSGRVQEAITVTNNESYTISLYLKNKNLSDTTQVWIGFSGSTQGSYVTITGEWQRYDVTTTSDNTTEYPRIQFEGTGSLYAWGFQVEQGDYATSYIPTSGSTVTRSADVENNSGNADLFNDSEGVLYAEIAALADDLTSRVISISNGTNNERVQIAYKNNNSNRIAAFIEGGGSNTGLQYDASDVTDFIKVALKYKSGDYALWVNGTERAIDTSAFTPTGLSELAFDSGSGASNFYGKVKAVSVFKEALTDAELQELTS